MRPVRKSYTGKRLPRQGQPLPFNPGVRISRTQRAPLSTGPLGPAPEPASGCAGACPGGTFTRESEDGFAGRATGGDYTGNSKTQNPKSPSGQQFPIQGG